MAAKGGREMRRAVFLLLVLAMVLGAAGVASADPTSVPNGPWVIPDQTVKVSSILTNEELGKALFDIEARSKGRLDVEQVGVSAGGYPIWIAKFGEPSPDKHGILVEANIHGNELAGNQASVEMIKYLAMSNNKEVLDTLEKCTIWFLPMLNPDGAMYAVDGERTPRRYNTMGWDPLWYGLPVDTPAPPAYFASRVGYDINRDFHYDLDFVLGLDKLAEYKGTVLPGAVGEFGFYVTPEARTWVRVFKALMPEFMISCHHQGTNVAGDSTDMVQVAILGQAVRDTGAYDGYGNLIPMDPAVITLGKKVTVNTWLEVGGEFAGVFGRYCSNYDAHSPRCSQACAMYNGCGIMLCEVRNQGTQKAFGMQVKILEKTMWETFRAFATESIYDVDVSLYEQIPIQERINNPHAD